MAYYWDHENARFIIASSACGDAGRKIGRGGPCAWGAFSWYIVVHIGCKSWVVVLPRMMRDERCVLFPFSLSKTSGGLASLVPCPCSAQKKYNHPFGITFCIGPCLDIWLPSSFPLHMSSGLPETTLDHPLCARPTPYISGLFSGSRQC